MTFKQRVRNCVIDCAKTYKDILLDYEYLLYSPDFVSNSYYIISASEDNYQHLTGVHSLVSAKEFFEMCLAGSLTEENFDFRKGSNSEKSIKGTIREKIKALPILSDLFKNKLQAEENFSKGHVHCFIAAANLQITLGFVKAKYAIPQTLLKGNQLDSKNLVDITIVLRRPKGSDCFDTEIQGDIKIFSSLHPDLVQLKP